MGKLGLPRDVDKPYKKRQQRDDDNVVESSGYSDAGDKCVDSGHSREAEAEVGGSRLWCGRTVLRRAVTMYCCACQRLGPSLD
jgi:hypothetical protein